MVLRLISRQAVFTLLLLLGSTSYAHDTVATDPVRGADLPALAARYELTRGKHSGAWYLWRTANRIETSSTLQKRSEIWEWNDKQQPSYQRFFHQDQKYIEYTNGQLLTQHITPDRVRLASIIDPALLSHLRRGRTERVLGRNAVHYQGMSKGRRIEVLWLEKEQLPAWLRQTGSSGSVTLRLKELQPLAPSSWPQVSEAMISSYTRVDGADLGDMEYDPFVAAVLAESGHDAHGVHKH